MGVGHEDQRKTLRDHRVSLSEKRWAPPRSSPETGGSWPIMLRFRPQAKQYRYGQPFLARSKPRQIGCKWVAFWYVVWSANFPFG
jgi:hypothetical protein